jgi:uncharacterized protein with PIN domain
VNAPAPERPVEVRFAEDLRLFLAARHRGGTATVAHDGTASVGHVVESLGVPLTEVGALLVGGVEVPASYRPQPHDVVDVRPVQRPQPLPTGRDRFLLDVHLGTLARRLRLLGVDAAYRNDADDDALVAEAVDQRRVLLSKDRGLLRRRALPAAAYVRGDLPDEQLRDVLTRFRPALAPFTRCAACNGVLQPAAKHEVLDRLEPGTRRSYDEFARCTTCGRVYWRGAHGRRIEAIVQEARRACAG